MRTSPKSQPFEWTRPKEGHVWSRCRSFCIRHWPDPNYSCWEMYDCRFADLKDRYVLAPQWTMPRAAIRRYTNAQLNVVKRNLYVYLDGFLVYPWIPLLKPPANVGSHGHFLRCPGCRAPAVRAEGTPIVADQVYPFVCGGEYGRNGEFFTGECPRLRLAVAVGLPTWTPPGIILDAAKERGIWEEK